MNKKNSPHLFAENYHHAKNIKKDNHLLTFHMLERNTKIMSIMIFSSILGGGDKIDEQIY